MTSFYKNRARLRCRNYYQRHRKRLLAGKKHYYLNHRQRIIAAAQRWYSENRVMVKGRRLSKIWHDWYLQRKAAICAGEHIRDWSQENQDRFWQLLHYHVCRKMPKHTPMKTAARINLEAWFS